MGNTKMCANKHTIKRRNSLLMNVSFTCLSSNALKVWYHIDNTLVIWRTLLSLLCVCEWSAVVPSEVRLQSYRLESESRTHGIRSVTASVCSHLSTDSWVIRGRSAQIPAHKHTHKHSCAGTNN